MSDLGQSGDWAQLALLPEAGRHAEAFDRFKREGGAYQYAIRSVQAEHEPRAVLASLDGCTVAPISRAEAVAIILKYEWLGTMGRATVASYGLRSAAGELLGVICFGVPGSPESRDICGRELRNAAICLERGTCVHWAPRNAASYLIRHSVRLAHRHHGWEIFYAYADEDAGEIGTVYQASNWLYLGQNVGRKKSDQHRLRESFRSAEGTVLSDRALRHRGLTKRQVLAAGWESLLAPPKHKYVWFEGRRRKHLKQMCRYPFRPYPKRPIHPNQIEVA